MSATGAAESCFDVATQAELNTHKTSTDHDSRYDGRYVGLSAGGQVTGPVSFFNGVNFNALSGTGATFNTNVSMSRFVTIGSGGNLSFPCPVKSNGDRLDRAGGWCLEPFINTTAATAAEAMVACHNIKMSLCPIEAILACDINDVGKGSIDSTCGNETDSESDRFILTGTLGKSNSGTAFGDFLIFNALGNVAQVAGENSAPTSAQYYCCLPAPTF